MLEDRLQNELLQSFTLYLIFGREYTLYASACEQANLLTLESRRVKISQKFAREAARYQKHQKWFKIDKATFLLP